MTGAGCPACRAPATAPATPAVPATPGAQAAYMARLGDLIAAHGDGPLPTAVIADICRAVAVIGQGLVRADEAYIRGLADGARARRAAERACEENRDG